MKVFVQSTHSPSQVLFAFDDAVDASLTGIRWAVAYSTFKGCQRLSRRIADRVGQSVWDACDKQFVVSLDFGLTEPAALEFLAALPHSCIRIANPEVVERDGFFPAFAYHPKLFLFDRAEATGYVVGSANLTEGGLITNTEMVVADKKPLGETNWDHVWKELSRDSSPLTHALLGTYKAKWVRPPAYVVEPIAAPKPSAIQPKTKPIFWDVVMNGAVVPADFNHMWIEAGSMSSGGAHNQLELPRGANRFFGFAHESYDRSHATIGKPILTLRQKQWDNRPLTWHGDNGMERLNLPTIAQGGVDYRRTSVLFRRRGHGFEIEVALWLDDQANAWRAASIARGMVFRLGARTSRICGLF